MPKDLQDMTFAEWLASHYRLLAGREEGDGGDGGEGDPAGAGDGDDGEDGDDPAGAGAPGSGSGGAGDGDDGDDDDEYVRIPKSEAAKIRKENAAFRRKAAEAEANAKREREKKLADEGRIQELLDEREAELQSAQDDKEAAEYELDRYKRENRVVGIAQRLGFRDPTDAVLHLSEDDTDDDETCEAALKRLAKKKKYLVNERMATGGASGGNGSGATLTMDDISRMSPDEVNARWAEVQSAMKASA